MALNCFNDAFQTALQIKDLEGISYSLNSIGGICKEKGYPLVALKFYRELMRFAEQIGKLDMKANRLINIGHIYQEMPDYSKAFDCFDEALQVYVQWRDILGEVKALNSIGLLFKEQRKYFEARKYYKKAFNIIVKPLNAPREKANCLNNIGMTYKK